MSQSAPPPSKHALTRDTDGNIDVHAWAKANLDQDIIDGTSDNLEAQQALLQADSQRNVHCLFIFHAEGYEFPMYVLFVRMTTQRYMENGADNMVR
ncbi:hypothetical protein PSPO01_09887 [Paraphaeosphaeria sporulosa]